MNPVTCQNGPLAAYKWHDKRTVTFISTADSPPDTGTVRRKKPDGSSVEVNCPNVVLLYNQHMNGVDMSDQLRQEYPTYRKSKKWWKYIMWFLFDVAACNAFLLMKSSPHHQMRSKSGKAKPRTVLMFRKELARQLIGNFRESRKRALVPNVDPEGNSHMPCKGNRSRCPQCTFNGKTSKPSTRCTSCGVALCLKCFEPYHKRMRRGSIE